MNEKTSVSTRLREAALLAREAGAVEVEHWCRLELGGYFKSNSAMSSAITVPEYRSVVGQHADIYGRILSLPSNLSFVGETRLRNGVEELEELAASRDTVVIHDSKMCEMIKEHLDVEVYSFRFSRVHLVGVLSSIRDELDAKIHGLKPAKQPLGKALRDEEIIELKPNFVGIGINLRALWRKFAD